MKTLSVLALSVIVCLSVSPRVDAAAQSNQTRDRYRGDQVCVYKDINYQGPEQCYGPGEVSNLGTIRKSISSIRVYGRATITVYENTDFRGRSAQFTSDVADLGRQMMAGNTAWSDHIDSLRITGSSGTSNVSGSRDRAREDQVCVYKDINYLGPEQCYGIGEVADLGATRKSISSIRVYGRATITVYENTDFRGRSAQFTSDVADLGRQMMAGNTAWSDHIDSLRITGSSGTFNTGGGRGNTDTYPRNSQGTPRDGICVYELPNYQGRSQCWNQGQSIANLARQDNRSSQISSIRLFGRAIAVVYQGANYQGESMTVDRDIPDLAAVAVRNNRGNARSQENSNARGRGNARGTTWDQHIASIHVQEQR